jgi:hypothetical protein
MSIENNQKNPSYDLLFCIVRELQIPADVNGGCIYNLP